MHRPITSRSLIRCLHVALLAAVLGLVGCDGSEAPADHQQDQHQQDQHQQDQHQQDQHQQDPHNMLEPVELTESAVERNDIRLEQARRGSIDSAVRAPATVEHDVERVAHLSPLVAGKIVEIRASLGDVVERGQTVAVLRSVELGEARARLREARAVVEVARDDYERQEELYQKGIAAERRFIEARGRLRQAEARLQAARERLEVYDTDGGSGSTYPLRSRIDGKIIEQHASVGEAVEPDDTLFVVGDQSVVWVIGRVSRSDLHRVRPDMDARVQLDAYPDRSWSGRITYVAETVDEETRTIEVRVPLENPDGLLKPGLFGELHLDVSDSDASPGRQVLVPEAAVQTLGGQPVVFVAADAPHTFVPRPVRLGTQSAGRVEILEGLEAGEPVVISGAFVLKSHFTESELGEGHAH